MIFTTRCLPWFLVSERGNYADFGTLAQLAKSLRSVFVYDGIYSEHRKRYHGRQVIGLSGHRFIGFVQNHDQVGNRAQGERLSHESGVKRAKVAAALVLTSPFVPMLFQGEEFAASAPFQYFTDFEDPELGKMISEGRKKEFEAFGWEPDQIPDPQDESTFERSKLDWAELGQDPHASMFQWYKALIQLRHSVSGLSDGDLNCVFVRFDEAAQWLVLERKDVHIACNLGKAPVKLEIGDDAKLLLASEESIQLSAGALTLEPDTVAIVSVKPR